MKRPFVNLAISLCLGISSSSFLKVPVIYPFILGIASIILSIFYSKKKIASHINLYLAVFFIGMAYYQNSNILTPDHIFNFTAEDEKKVFLRGAITDDPIISATFYKAYKTTFILNASFLKEGSEWRKVRGLVKVDIYKNKAPLSFGDEVMLEGLLSRPNSLRNPNLFDYSKYLAIKDIYSALKVKEGFFIGALGAGSPYIIKKTAYNLRYKIRHVLDRYFDEPFAGFLKAILIGDRAALNETLSDDFIKTGTVHVIAISGLNVALIAAIFLFILGVLRVPKRLNLVLTMLFLIFYSIVAGSSPPIIRAVIMFSIFVLGSVINREADTLNSLSAAAILVLLWNPKELFDPSFQLSFISIASIIIFTPRIDALIGLDPAARTNMFARIKFYILKSISVSTAAWIGVSPLVSRYFNIVSPIAAIANILVVPALFAVTALSFLLIFVSAISDIFAIYLAGLICAIQGATFFTNHKLAGLPLAYFRIPSPTIGFLFSYYMLLSFPFLPKTMELGRIKIYKRYLFIIILLSFNLLVWKDVVNYGNDKLKITFLDVGHGDSILIQFPKKGTILIDGGSGGKGKFDIGKSVIAPYLWNSGITRLDAVILTHFHEDHIGGMLYILKNFNIGCAIDNGATVSASALYDRYKRIIKGKRIRRFVVGEGDEVSPLNDARLFILNPEKGDDLLDSNDNSIVLKLVYKNSSVLFCGDITYKTMERLASYDGFLKSDILKVPHHGGAIGDEKVVKDFFENVSPEISIISAGKRNSFQALLNKTADIITSLNSRSYITKDKGAIIVFIEANSFEALPYVK